MTVTMTRKRMAANLTPAGYRILTRSMESSRVRRRRKITLMMRETVKAMTMRRRLSKSRRERGH